MMYSFQDDIFTHQDLVLTHHPRFVNGLHTIYRNIQKDHTVFEIPSMTSIQQWLRQLWKESSYQLSQTPILLMPIQSYCLFKITLNHAHGFVHSKDLKRIYETWVNQKSYLDFSKTVSEDLLGKALDGKKTVLNLIARCQKNNWIHEPQLTSFLMHNQCIEYCQIPKKIYLQGARSNFQPYESFLQHLEQSGCQIESLVPHQTKKNTIQHIILDNSDQEIDTMIHWAWDYWSKHGQKPVGCVIPNLKMRRDFILSRFQEIYQRLYQKPLPTVFPVYFSFENTAFKHHPMISMAMDVLQLENPIDINLLSRIFKSPHLNSTVSLERYQWIRLDVLLKQHFLEPVPFPELTAFIQSHCPDAAVIDRMTTWYANVPKETVKHTYTEWAKFFKAQLAIWGWAEQNLIHAEERDYLTQWSSVLDQLASLDFVLEPTDHVHALDALKEILESFEVPESSHIPLHGIHLMDPKDTLYFSCEKIWWMEFNGYKSSSVELPEVIASLQAHVPEIMISTCKASLQDDAIFKSIQQKTSISNLTLSSLNLKPLPTLDSQMTPLIQWEYFYDERAPKIKTMFETTGTGLLKAQAECPFRAFSEYRLQLGRDRIKTASVHQLHYEKSKLFSRILGKIWEHLKTQSELNKISSTQLNHLVHKIVEKESALCVNKHPTVWNTTVNYVEKERLFRLVLGWLNKEKTRSLFTVQSLNSKIELAFKQLKISVPVDRIDRLEDGTSLLLKYHTGTLPTRKQWFDPTPATFSLTLPSLNLKNSKQALAFLHFNAEHDGKLFGISTHVTSHKKQQVVHLEQAHKTLSILWKDTQVGWNTYFKKLADQFQTGYAVIKPDAGAKSCRNCKQHLLCRIKQINSD